MIADAMIVGAKSILVAMFVSVLVTVVFPPAFLLVLGLLLMLLVLCVIGFATA